jgi:hypothetical protein
MKKLTFRLNLVRAIAPTILAGILLAAGTARAQDDGQASMSFVVLRDYNGKPVRNASVVLHPVKKDGKQAKGGLELKADADGKCNYDGVPYGKVRVQVLAPGFETFGQDYDIDKPSVEITVKLKRPQEQYSIYSDHQNDKKGDPPSDKSAEPSDPNAKPK